MQASYVNVVFQDAGLCLLIDCWSTDVASLFRLVADTALAKKIAHRAVVGGVRCHTENVRNDNI